MGARHLLHRVDAEPARGGATGRVWVVTTLRADLYELSRGAHPGRAPGDGDTITLFENCGGGHLDLMVARHLFRQVSGSERA